MKLIFNLINIGKTCYQKKNQELKTQQGQQQEKMIFKDK